MSTSNDLNKTEDEPDVLANASADQPKQNSEGEDELKVEDGDLQQPRPNDTEEKLAENKDEEVDNESEEDESSSYGGSEESESSSSDDDDDEDSSWSCYDPAIFAELPKDIQHELLAELSEDKKQELLFNDTDDRHSDDSVPARLTISGGGTAMSCTYEGEYNEMDK